MPKEEEEEEDTGEILTFASVSRAKKGFQFVHRGHLPGCKACQFFFVCQQPLKKYQVYEIVEVRKKQHECPNNYHEEPMQVVKVVKLGKHVAMPKKGTFASVNATYVHQHCVAFECPHRPECVSTTVIFPGQKVKVRDIVRDISADCRMGYQLVLVDCDTF
ncbi:MAG TPA: UPF0179 family protein [Candidatus Lokiarchaeia archaeon]|nr:UPF0179 family protein [Candidatus Lokiarchaeia archaeon]